MDDGWLDAVLYTDFSKREYIRHAISISQGRRPFTPKILHRRTRALHIKTDEPVEIQADGVAHGHTPVQITIVPHALNVQAPQMPGPGLHPLENRASHLYQAERKQTYA
jgi:diacylglycerol kinase family enzyme